MMKDTDTQRILQRQELMIGAIHQLAETVAITNAMVEKVLEWMQKPAGTELRDALADLATAVEANTVTTNAMEQRIVELPAAVARAVTTGQV